MRLRRVDDELRELSRAHFGTWVKRRPRHVDTVNRTKNVHGFVVRRNKSCARISNNRIVGVERIHSPAPKNLDQPVRPYRDELVVRIQEFSTELRVQLHFNRRWDWISMRRPSNPGRAGNSG